jgi:hypothetical protein
METTLLNKLSTIKSTIHWDASQHRIVSKFGENFGDPIFSPN